MTIGTNRRVVLARRPRGEPRDDDFRLESEPVSEPGDGEVLLKTLWLSLDPYMRMRMGDARSYAPPLGLGEVMVGGTVNQVVQSTVDDLAVGDIVTSFCGWQEYAVKRPHGDGVRKVDPGLGPLSYNLGLLGMPGHTAYFGLQRIGKPIAGETVVVSSAAGAVGSVVGQIAKIRGCRAVGIAGGPQKCAYVHHELGLDACVDYKAGHLEADLRAACPSGIDVYFENVGGTVLEAVAPLLNDGARVPICGFISAYNAIGPVRTPFAVLGAHPKKPAHRFFLVNEWAAEARAATTQLAEWLDKGQLRYKESIVDGLENAPRALRGMLRGENFGKQLVRVAEPD